MVKSHVLNSEHCDRIPGTPGSDRVPMEIHVFHVNKSCFQLDVVLARGSSRLSSLNSYYSFIL